MSTDSFDTLPPNNDYIEFLSPDDFIDLDDAIDPLPEDEPIDVPKSELEWIICNFEIPIDLTKELDDIVPRSDFYYSLDESGMGQFFTFDEF